MNNQEIRNMAKTAGVRLWEVADAIGIADTTFCRKLRKELPADEKEKILSVIAELAKEAV